MVKFCAESFIDDLWQIEAILNLHTLTHGESPVFSQKEKLVAALESLEVHCREIGLEITLDHCEQLVRQLTIAFDRSWMTEFDKEGLELNPREIFNSCDKLKISLRNELEKKKFAFIPQQNAVYFEQEKLFGPTVFDAFETARQDIKDAGYCLSADLNTAAVFHLMRVVNIGARALAHSLGINTVKGRELEYCRDDSIYKAIEDGIDAKLKSVKDMERDASWESENAFYRGLLTDLRYFKDAARDPIAHARKNYEKKSAIEVYNHVQEFMQRLTNKISK